MLIGELCWNSSFRRVYISAAVWKTSQGARKGGDRWQAQAEKRWLAGFLANIKVVVLLLSFLKVTKVGEGGSNDQAGEENPKTAARKSRYGQDESIHVKDAESLS